MTAEETELLSSNLCELYEFQQCLLTELVDCRTYVRRAPSCPRQHPHGFTAGAKYGFGPANVSVGYSLDDPDDGEESNVLAFSADYGLFPGVTVKGDLSFNDEDSDDDGGSTTAGVVTLQLNY